MLFPVLTLALAMSGQPIARPQAAHVQQTQAEAPQTNGAADSATLLAAALKQAKADNKYVFLWFSAPW